MPETIHQISSAIGSLRTSVEFLTSTWKEQDRQATEGRRILYGKFDDLKSEFTKLVSRVDNLTADIGEIKPTVREFSASNERTNGVKNLGKVLWSGLIALAGGIGWIFSEIFRSGVPPHH